MRKCPRCGQISFDNSQNFCLNDGETLIFTGDSQPTVKIDPRSFSTASTPPKQGVSAGFAYATIALLALLIGGGVVALILINPFAAKTESSNLAQNQQNTAVNSANAVANSAANQPIVSAPQTAPPATVKTPAPLPKPKRATNYAGTIDGIGASFDLIWNERTKRVSGNYYTDADPNEVYTVSGTNFVEGVSELSVSSGGNYIGQMKLNKTFEGNILCWQGYLSAGNQYVRFCRRR